ncbi:hypothetical protein [Segatella copri]|uniref:hypothetical protein n=1 Tax=Segatella copri TaxID=165179 RepID=UPI0020CFE6C5|nr:hypothetical protein [Segatella copri]MCP9529194.1 hypothetical protein [Segatella copri]MCP9597469.1 hypothetical protein [Segatella copri]
MKYDTRQIGIKSPDGLLVEKCRMPLDELTNRRMALCNKFREDMNNLATEYAVRNSKFHVGDIVKVEIGSPILENLPCEIIEVFGSYNAMMAQGRPAIMYVVQDYNYRENVTRLRKIRLSVNFHNVRNMTFS